MPRDRTDEFATLPRGQRAAAILNARVNARAPPLSFCAPPSSMSRRNACRPSTWRNPTRNARHDGVGRAQPREDERPAARTAAAHLERLLREALSAAVHRRLVYS